MKKYKPVNKIVFTYDVENDSYRVDKQSFEENRASLRDDLVKAIKQSESKTILEDAVFKEYMTKSDVMKIINEVLGDRV